jgi:hypothetical protein
MLIDSWVSLLSFIMNFRGFHLRITHVFFMPWFMLTKGPFQCWSCINFWTYQPSPRIEYLLNFSYHPGRGIGPLKKSQKRTSTISASGVEGMNHEFTWWEMQVEISKSETNTHKHVRFHFSKCPSKFFFTLIPSSYLVGTHRVSW